MCDAATTAHRVDGPSSPHATMAICARDITASDGTVAVVAIDITFDFRTDASGRDPDASSPTLLQYHHLLWSKPLPSGRAFDLTPQTDEPYALIHDSDLGWFRDDERLGPTDLHPAKRHASDHRPVAAH